MSFLNERQSRRGMVAAWSKLMHKTTFDFIAVNSCGQLGGMTREHDHFSACDALKLMLVFFANARPRVKVWDLVTADTGSQCLHWNAHILYLSRMTYQLQFRLLTVSIFSCRLAANPDGYWTLFIKQSLLCCCENKYICSVADSEKQSELQLANFPW